jgi:hypothetical protein
MYRYEVYLKGEVTFPTIKANKKSNDARIAIFLDKFSFIFIILFHLVLQLPLLAIHQLQSIERLINHPISSQI